MKNAKCDICNREFSTQSYLQLHIKLHYRKSDYRLKVFEKAKYGNSQKALIESQTKNEGKPRMKRPYKRRGIKLKINLKGMNEGKQNGEIEENKLVDISDKIDSTVECDENQETNSNEDEAEIEKHSLNGRSQFTSTYFMVKNDLLFKGRTIVIYIFGFA